jgi:hypothetical protein
MGFSNTNYKKLVSDQALGYIIAGMRPSPLLGKRVVPSLKG